MPTAVNPGKGTLLKVKIVSTYTTIAQRVKLDGPDLSVDTSETTNLDSGKKTYRATIADAGSVSGTLQFDPADATHAKLFDLWQNPPATNASFQVVFADSVATTYQFDGILTKLKPTGMEVGSNLEAEFEVKISGDITKTST